MHGNFFISTARGPAFLAALLLCAGMARAAEPLPTPEMRAHFDAGVRHLDQKRYGEAYRSFKEAYALSPQWKVLGNLGTAAEHLERDGEAIDAYAGTLKQGGAELTPKAANRLRRSIERLESESASITLEAPGTFWIIDTRLDGADGPIVNPYGPFENVAELRVRPGQHDIQLDRATIASPMWSVRLDPRNVARHVFEAEAPPGITEELVVEPPPAMEAVGEELGAEPSHMASYVLWGTGAAASVATVILLLEGDRLQREANEQFAKSCPFGSTPSGVCSDLDAYHKAGAWRTAGLITGIGAVGALATGTLLYFLNSNDSADGGDVQQATIQPWVSPTGIGLSGAF